MIDLVAREILKRLLPENYSVQLDLPNTQVKLPHPLLYAPDMNNRHSNTEWIKQTQAQQPAAIRFPYSEDDGKGGKNHYTIFNIGFENCACERDRTIFLYAYVDELYNINPLCADVINIAKRNQRTDDPLLLSSDILYEGFLQTPGTGCKEWHDGDPVTFCEKRGNGKSWGNASPINNVGASCYLPSGAQFVAFLKISDAPENPHKTIPNLGLKAKIPIYNYGDSDSVDLANSYDPITSTLAMRLHFAIGNIVCGTPYSFGINPNAPNAKYDNSAPDWYYYAFQNLILPDDLVPVPEALDVPAEIALSLLAVAGVAKWRKNRFAQIKGNDEVK